MKLYDSLIFEQSVSGRKGYTLPKRSYPKTVLPQKVLRETCPGLPEVSEIDVVRHYTNVSQKNYGIETGMYPLGSCTMKYNPKINQDISHLPAFSSIHPYQPIHTTQGILKMLDELQKHLSEISGLAQYTLNSYAGAHGELIGLMIMKAYFESRGESHRTKIIVPDAAHGTNPASAVVAGFKVVEVPSEKDGSVNIEALKGLIDDELAGIMLTNPNTLGMFERNILDISQMIHEHGGLLYYDGANLNPIVGRVRPGDMGFDIMHINLHKTFSTPHGGGGPGSGPVGVAEHLVPFLPKPVIKKTATGYTIETDNDTTLGQISHFYGNVGVALKAYTYILSNGKEHLPEVAAFATLNANYVKESLKDLYELPAEGVCKHEFVFNGLKDKSGGVTTLNVAKRLLDFGVHPPTIYFPLLYKESLMIEPVETESKQTLDHFIAIMRQVALEAKEKPEFVKAAPHNTVYKRLDEAQAARQPIVTFSDI